MTVEEKIRLVAERMDKLTYMFCDLTEANFRLDYECLPAMVNVIPLSGSIRVTPTQIKHYPNCSFWFVDRVDIDADGDTIGKVVDRCMRYAYEFILWLNASKLFEPIENTDVSITTITSDLDVNVSGVVMEVQLRERQGLVLCLDKQPNEYFDNERGCNEGCPGRTGEPTEEDN